MSLAKRHQWAATLRDGIGERCVRHGCGLERRQKANPYGEATSVSEYRNADDGEEWRTYKRVPECRGA